jgi:Sec-independent protein secretion pathway component TatC
VSAYFLMSSTVSPGAAPAPPGPCQSTFKPLLTRSSIGLVSPVSTGDMASPGVKHPSKSPDYETEPGAVRSDKLLINEDAFSRLMNSRSWIPEPIGAFRTFRAPFLAFSAILVSLLVIPNPLLLTSGGSYSPLVSLFIEGIKSEVLPPGWTLIVSSPGAPLEINVAASVTLALLVSSPIISYQIIKSIAPALASRKRALYSLVACASALLAAGTLFGVFFAHDSLLSMDPFFDTSFSAPFVDAASFYLAALRAIGVSAVAFTLPVYIYALVRFRLLRTK